MTRAGLCLLLLSLPVFAQPPVPSDGPLPTAVEPAMVVEEAVSEASLPMAEPVAEPGVAEQSLAVTPATWVDALADAGFVVERLETLPGGGPLYQVDFGVFKALLAGYHCADAFCMDWQFLSAYPAAGVVAEAVNQYNGSTTWARLWWSGEMLVLSGELAMLPGDNPARLTRYAQNWGAAVLDFEARMGEQP